MGYYISKPSEILSPYIKQYWMIDNCFGQNESHIQQIIPSGLMELAFYLADKPESSNNPIPDKSVISGQINEPYEINVNGNLSMFSVSFQPEGAMMFFDLPLIKIFGKNVSLRNIIKNVVSQLEAELFNADSFHDKIRIIEKFLIKQLNKNYKQYIENRISHSVKLINKTRGRIAIDFLASSACLSRKQYERVFKDYIGIAPKQFLRIVRFQNIIYEKQLDIKIPLTKLAYDCGYFDQSHMIHEFKLLSGNTPRRYFSDCDPYSDYFSI